MTEIAEAQRARNARWITATLALLSALAALQTLLLFEGQARTVWLTAGCGALIGGGYLLVRRGYVAAGILMSCACLLVQHVGVVAIEGELGPVPYLVSVALLLVAASAPGRWLPLAFALTLLALGLEAALSPWSRADQIATTTSILLTTIVFVVSLLHVRGTERAFELAEQQNRARSEAAATAMASEERYRWIADHADDLIGLVTSRGRAVYLSPSHERLLGVPVSEALGGRLHRAVRLQNLRDAIGAFVETAEIGEGRVELCVRDRNGEQRILDSVLKRVKSPEGMLITLISRDITERRRLEQQVLTAQRMEALGRLAGSVAHDFNNLLTVITSAAELVRRALPKGHRSKGDLDAILTATQTATSLTYQLLTFSKKQLVVKTPLDLVEALQEQRQLLARMVGSRVELTFHFSEGLPKVLMPAAHLDQLAMNFAINARDAMPNGGRLTFTLRERRIPASATESLPPGHYIELAVADEGSGIPEDHVPHLFDPFFTTKGKEGTGLGLATCMSIATQAGGAIRVQSQLGVGTTFRVLLPASRGDQSPPSGARLPQHVNRVLVVDDERAIRMMIARTLQAAGHDVQLASTLQGAQRLIADDLKAPLDVVVTDVVLSSDRGTDLLAFCRQHRPGLRIVVMSGYAPDPKASELLVLHGARFLPKPFSRAQLLKAIS